MEGGEGDEAEPQYEDEDCNDDGQAEEAYGDEDQAEEAYGDED